MSSLQNVKKKLLVLESTQVCGPCHGSPSKLTELHFKNKNFLLNVLIGDFLESRNI